ncbi:MAG: hypothetical protein AABZ43_00430 [Planctomycetota bacterium]
MSFYRLFNKLIEQMNYNDEEQAVSVPRLFCVVFFNQAAFGSD